LLRALVWAVLALTLGNLVASGYVLLARARSRGDWHAFWMGFIPSDTVWSSGW
jgi:hypothetical protein